MNTQTEGQRKRPISGEEQGVEGSSSTRVIEVQFPFQWLAELFDNSSYDKLYFIHVTNHYY